MKFYSILFTFESVCENLGLNTLWWCHLWFNELPKRARKFQRVVTLVEAASEDEALQIRRQTHPELFADCTTFEIIEVASREEWTSLPSCTFKFPPIAKVLEFEPGGWVDLSFRPNAQEAMERDQRLNWCSQWERVAA